MYVENGLVDTAGKGEGGTNQEGSINACTPLLFFNDFFLSTSDLLLHV